MDKAEQLYRVQRNCIQVEIFFFFFFFFSSVFSCFTQMMRDRGYIIPQEFDKDTMTKEVFMLRYANNEQLNVERELLKMRFVHQTERHKILVMFEQNAKVGKKEVERLCERMGEDKRCVLILDGAVSSAARIQIESMNPTIVIEVSATEEKYSGGKDAFNFFFFFFFFPIGFGGFLQCVLVRFHAHCALFFCRSFARSSCW
jgi:hypothetical protein